MKNKAEEEEFKNIETGPYLIENVHVNTTIVNIRILGFVNIERYEPKEVKLEIVCPKSMKN